MRFVFLAFILSMSPVWAQVHLPPMEASVRAGAMLFGMGDVEHNNYNYGGMAWQGELRWNVTQHISLGAFGAKSSGMVKFETDGGDGENFKGNSHYAVGGSLRLSTGRKPRFRPFMELSLGKFEVSFKTDTNLKNSGSFVGYAIGLMIKVSKNMYVVFPQATIRARKKHFDVEKASDFAFGKYGTLNEIYGGLVINFGKR